MATPNVRSTIKDPRTPRKQRPAVNATTTIVWEPTPEDDTIEWTRPNPHLGGLYAIVAQTSHITTSADYALPHRQTIWHWATYEDVTGEELTAGQTRNQSEARHAAESSLHNILALEHVQPEPRPPTPTAPSLNNPNTPQKRCETPVTPPTSSR